MDVVQILEMADRCIARQAPACSRACPLGVDVLDMVEKVRDGGVSAAYRIYYKSAVFPRITSRICTQPCNTACLRAQVDEPINLKAIEKQISDQMAKRPAANYFVPEKETRVLIVGGGLTGLSCAVKFAQNGYQVELLEQSDRLGGRLWGVDEAILPRDILEDEIRRVTDLGTLEIRLNTAVETLDQLKAYRYNSALIATGEGGERFGLQPNAGGGVHAGDSIFLGGSLMDPGRDPLYSIKDGVSLFYVMEGYMKAAWFDDTEKPEPVLFIPDPARVAPEMPPDAADPDNWTKEEAKQEAFRCQLCSCQNCVDVSDMLCYFDKTPRKTLQDISNSINKTAITQKVGLRQIMGCNQCGLCLPACPVGIDFKNVCIESRRLMHRDQGLPQAIYAFWLEDMAFSNGEEAAFFFAPPANKTPKYLFFPGCQLGASDPRYVTGSYDMLCQAMPGEVGIMTHCCGAPADWAGQVDLHEKVLREIRGRWEELGKPQFILACPTCREMFDTHLPEVETTSLWEVLAGAPLAAAIAPQAGAVGTAVSVFDPCSSKYHPAEQQSVRTLVSALGMPHQELPAHGADSRCCGFGGLSATAVPNVGQATMQKNIALGENPYVTYCSNCRDSFAQNGKPVYHLLDLALPGMAADPLRPPPNLGTRRKNRREIKRILLKEIWDVAFTVEKEPHQLLQLHIPDELMDKMNRALVHEDNVKKTIFEAEATKGKIFNPETSAYTAHLLQGMLTYWVVYTPRADGSFDVKNVYRHRMQIEEKPLREANGA